MCRSLSQPGELTTAAVTPAETVLAGCAVYPVVVGTRGNGWYMATSWLVGYTVVLVRVPSQWSYSGLTVGFTVAYSGVHSGPPTTTVGNP